MSERGIKFAIASTGAVLEGATVRHGSRMPGGQEPWALFGMPIAAMLTRAGIAWIEFVLEEGDGYVYLLVAHETLDKSAGVLAARVHGVVCDLSNGGVRLDGATLRWSTAGWGARWRMSAGERVRLVYVDATRMVRVIWRGISTDLVALPAAHDNESMRFGVSVATGNTVRVTGASAGAWARAQVVCRAAAACFRGWRQRLRSVHLVSHDTQLVVSRSAVPCSACGFRGAHSRDDSGGPGPPRGRRARRHLVVGVRARTALGRRTRLHAPARLLEHSRGRVWCTTRQSSVRMS